MSNLMNIDKVAEYLGVSKATVYNLINQKDLPFIKIGRSTRFELTSINEWIEKQNN